MKKIVLILLSALSLTVMAKDVKLALLQPLTTPGSTACNPMEISMVRGELRKAFGWQSNFQVLTRTDVDAMLKEQGFQRSGMVEDEQRKEVGKMTGAQYICVSTITKYNTQLYIEAYLVDVETGKMTNPATQYVNIMDEDYSLLPSSCNELAREMLGEIRSPAQSPIQKGDSHIDKRSTDKNYTEKALGVNMKMIWVEGGDFLMGCTSEQSGCRDNEKNVRRVSVDGFYIGMLEVTQSQWEKVMGTSIYQQRDKADSNRPMRGVGPVYPMYYVSWEEATEFCRRLSKKTGKTYTLPTEAQWEYAARGGKNADGTKYAGSNMIDAVAWYTENSGGSTHPCGTKRANALGIYNMSGNVYEWCQDWKNGNYTSYDTINPTGPSSGTYRVGRGGSWYRDDTHCQVVYRFGISPHDRGGDLGFRVVCIP